jgi:hypothetical protein
MSETANLALPLLAAAQAQKHVTHNEALTAIDALLNCAVLDRDLTAPPATPEEGARYLVAAAPSGAWAGRAGKLAAWQTGAWAFFDPKPGFVAYLVDEALLLVFDGTAWTAVVPSALQNLTRLGVATAADAANPFAAKLNAALWTAKPAGEGGNGDLRYTLNKEGSADTLSLLFQSGYSGRAEWGLIGDDDLQLKMSADGSTWLEAIHVTADGKVGLGTATPAERLSVAGNIAPAVDNAYSIGTAARRASTIYAATGVINTSDLRLKQEVVALDPRLAATLVRAAPPIAFRWRVGGLELADPDADPVPRPGRRTHFGWSAQSWREALAAHTVDAGLLVMADPNDPDSDLGLRPDQITAVLHAALLAAMTELASLSERLASLENDRAAVSRPGPAI